MDKIEDEQISDGKLNLKQQRFWEEYLIDLNATQAAIRAGYSENCAGAVGWEVLKKPEVQKRVMELKAVRSKRTEITADQVIEELSHAAFANILDYLEVQDDGLAVIDLTKVTREQAAAIQELNIDGVAGIDGDKLTAKKLRFKLRDKNQALTKLGEHLGMFTQVHRHEGALDVDLVSEGLKRARERNIPDE